MTGPLATSTPMYRIQVMDGSQVVLTESFGAALEVGRQEVEEPHPVVLCRRGDVARLVVASHEETSVGRRQLKIAPRSDGRVELTNLSPRVAIAVAGEDPLLPNATRSVDIAALLTLGRKSLRILNLQTPAGMNSLPDATIAPGSLRRRPAVSPVLEALRNAPARVAGGAPTTPSAISHPAEAIVRALQVTMDVFQQAASAEEFFASAVDGAIELVGLHSASVILFRDGAWTEGYSRCSDSRAGAPPASRSVLAGVVEHKRTFWDNGLDRGDSPASLAGVDAVIAAPILDRRGHVSAALYGDRRLTGSRGDLRPIGGLDAQLIELLACGVAAGLARLEQEESARRLQLRFEQFNSREVARALEACPTLLDGRDVDATMLFCDVRGFSRISGKFGSASATFPWINDVLESLSECVTQHGGVLVDYIGDELMAMWGAPQEQPDHAARACRAAADMLGRLPGLNDRWAERIGEPVAIGIGVNSGRVRAGNTGSTRRFKYGPLGSPVNIASRAQGATKFLKVSVLLTEDTAQLLGTEFPLRRLGAVGMVNIAEPVCLYELMRGPADSVTALRTTYELALREFEEHRFRQSAASLAPLLNTFADDGPSLLLMSRVVNAMVHGPEVHHPVWILPGK